MEAGQLNTPAQSVTDLALGLGQLMGAEGCPSQRQPAYECFVESVLVLAFAAGLGRDESLQPFDLHRQHAEKVWERLVETASND